MSIPVSCLILAFNEEANIAACLESLRWAAEVLVVDSLSTERSAQCTWRADMTIRSFCPSSGLGLHSGRTTYLGIPLGAHLTVSQYAFLCTATHDYEDPDFSLVTRRIEIGDYAWIGARAFVGPGVSIGEGAVVEATASVYRDVPEWTVVGGNPAKVIKQKVMKGSRRWAVGTKLWTQNQTPETRHLTPET